MAKTFVRSNEDLPSILRGMDVNPSDYILAVGGSGDQSFALLEYVQRVKALDIDRYQVTHINKQADCISRQDYEGFWKRSKGNGYFDRERLDRLNSRIQFFEIVMGDIIDICQSETGFNKVYLSNALTGHPDELTPKLRKLWQSLPLGGLAYASNGNTIYDALNGSGFIFDEFLTSLTRDENWNPIILRKG